MTYDGAVVDGGTSSRAEAAPGRGDRLPSPAARARSVALRLGAAAAGAAFLGALKVNRPPGLATVCVLRGTTGIPCPFCGGTTVFVRLGQGRLLDAVLTNPVVLLLALAVVLAPTGVFAPLRRWRAASVAPWVLVAFAWVWQLGRFGYLT